MTLSLQVLSFDRDGVLVDPDDVLGRVLTALADRREPVTDVFVVSHGWLNDREQAVASYRAWAEAMSGYAEIWSGLGRRRPGFRALLIGVHWPSRPWLPVSDAASVSLPLPLSSSLSLEARVAFHRDVLGDPGAVDDLRPLLERADSDPDVLSARDEERFRRLDERSGLGTGRVGAAPGSDREAFEPGRIFHEYRALRVGSALLAPLWVTSFWAMKRRALRVGGTGVHDLLALLQRADGTGAVRWHLAGHSFGAIVCLAGLRGADPLPRPVDSCVLLQGALSAWSLAPRIPNTTRAGYFHPVLADGLVRGPVVSTYSRHDRALNWFYRVAARRGGDPTLRPRAVPRYAAAGSYGFAGLPGARDLTVPGTRLRHVIAPVGCTNADCTAVVRGSSFSVQGGHSDLAHPELAGLVWAAVTASGEGES